MQLVAASHSPASFRESDAMKRTAHRSHLPSPSRLAPTVLLSLACLVIANQATALTTATCSSPAKGSPSAIMSRPDSHLFAIRAITAGVNLKSPGDLTTVTEAITFLKQARQRLESAGYVVQGVRIATQPLPDYLAGRSLDDVLPDLKRLDNFLASEKVTLSIGPVLSSDRYDPGLAHWAAQLLNETSQILFTVKVASEQNGVFFQSLRAAAEAMVAISKSTPGGEGNFRFAATANYPAGGPFFPAAYHQGENDFSIGIQSPNLLREAFRGAADFRDARKRLAASMESEFKPIEKLALEISQSSGRKYGGIDVSPAPAVDASIGAAIETLTGVPFGSSSTLAAAATITDVLHGLSVKRCGYSGLMLPVLEDPVLATRAAEGRFGVRELLLYSSVCGTGLDLVPLAGDTPAPSIAALIGDVAALSVKLHKPLSARLFLVPGKKAGDHAEFASPHLTGSVVMKL
jgi:uncharacterized protein (UPF0210 family)